jgi:hypothetical protein
MWFLIVRNRFPKLYRVLRKEIMEFRESLDLR